MRLRNAIIALCRATDRVIFHPANQQLRTAHAQAVDALLAITEEALDFLESEGA